MHAVRRALRVKKMLDIVEPWRLTPTLDTGVAIIKLFKQICVYMRWDSLSVWTSSDPECQDRFTVCAKHQDMLVDSVKKRCRTCCQVTKIVLSLAWLNYYHKLCLRLASSEPHNMNAMLGWVGCGKQDEPTSKLKHAIVARCNCIWHEWKNVHCVRCEHSARVRSHEWTQDWSLKCAPSYSTISAGWIKSKFLHNKRCKVGACNRALHTIW